MFYIIESNKGEYEIPAGDEAKASATRLFRLMKKKGDCPKLYEAEIVRGRLVKKEVGQMRPQ